MTRWQGKTPHSVYWKFYILCGLLFWLIIPLFLAWKRYLHVQNTVYYLDESGAGTENSINPDSNRFFDIDRITSIETMNTGINQLLDVHINTINKKIPPIHFPSVPITPEVIDSFESHRESIRSKTTIQSISLPVLQ